MQINEVAISTRHFENVHGKKPSGHGSWAFSHKLDLDDKKIFWHNGPYEEAKRAAEKHAKKHGHTELHVLSESTIRSTMNEDSAAVVKRSLDAKRMLDAAARSKIAKKVLDDAAAKKRSTMKENFEPVADVITLVANDQHAEATGIVNDLLSARVLDSLQDHKQTIAQSLFAPSADALSEETEELDEISSYPNPKGFSLKKQAAARKKANTMRVPKWVGSGEEPPTGGRKPNYMKEETLEETEQLDEEGKKWIAGAIKHKGALHAQLHVPAGEKIPAGKLEAAAHKGGKLGKRARLAQTLKSLHEEEIVQEEHESVEDLVKRGGKIKQVAPGKAYGAQKPQTIKKAKQYFVKKG